MAWMPGTIETDGSGAPIPPQTTISPSSHPRRMTEAVTLRWQRLSGTPGAVRASVVAAALLWAASAVTWTLECLRIHRTDSGLGWDLVTSWRAEQAFVHGSQPYSLADTHHRLFLYPPSSLILMRPIALFSLHGVAVWGLVATAAMTWAAVMISAAALGRRWWGLTAAIVVFALRFAQPVVAELGLENVTVLCTLALAAFFLFAKKDQWVWAAVAIGVTLSIKPLLLPVLVIFVLVRQWRGLAVAVAIPAVLNVVAFAVVTDPSAVFAKLPSLLNRSGTGVQLNSAWVDVLRSFGVPDYATILIRLATVAIVLVAAWWSWQRLDDFVLRVVTTTSLLLIGTYLAGTLSENHFMLTLVPLAMTVILPRSPMRSVAAWLGVLLFMGLTPPGSVLGLDAGANLSAWRAFGMILVVLSVLVTLGRRRSSRSPRTPHDRPSAAGGPELTATTPDSAGAVREALAR
jgi:arabinofuranan 3-O-arabinosyltransferase